MKKLTFAALLVWLAFAPAAFAANVNIDGLPAAGSVAGTNLFECEQSGTNRQCTAAQMAAYVYGLTSADATISGTGAVTLATVNANVGSFGSATNCVTFTTNAKGLITAASQTTCTPALASITGFGTGVASALAAALNSSTGAIGALTPTNNNCVVGNGTAWTSAACPGGGSGVANLAIGGGLVSATNAACSQTTISAGGSTISAAECVNAQVGTTYTFLESDRAKLVAASNTASQAYTLPQSTSSAFVSGWSTRIKNINTGPVVITPTTSTINGAASLTVLPNITVKITADGANYTASFEAPTSLATQTLTGTNPALISSYYGNLIYLSNAANQVPTLAQAGTTGFPNGWYAIFCNINAGTQTITPTTSTIGGAATFVIPAGTAAGPKCVGVQSDGTNYNVAPYFFRFGTGVEVAAAAALSSAGGLPTIIASGTIALGTSAVSAGACGSAATSTATGAVSTDTIQIGFNGDPTATTGYLPTAMLTLVPYPTTNTVNVKQCNLTASSITPSALTLNWKIMR